MADSKKFSAENARSVGEKIGGAPVPQGAVALDMVGRLGHAEPTPRCAGPAA